MDEGEEEFRTEVRKWLFGCKFYTEDGLWHVQAPDWAILGPATTLDEAVYLLRCHLILLATNKVDAENSERRAKAARKEAEAAARDAAEPEIYSDDGLWYVLTPDGVLLGPVETMELAALLLQLYMSLLANAEFAELAEQWAFAIWAEVQDAVAEAARKAAEDAEPEPEPEPDPGLNI